MWLHLEGKYKNVKHYFRSLWEVARQGYPARKLIVVGVTGTDGKTTTSHLIYEMLKTAGKKVALVSTVAAYIGDEEIDTGFHVTTPDAKFLQPFVRKVVEAGMEYLVLETTSHGLDQHRVLGCNFLVGVVTNVTHEHLDYHQTFAKYLQAKAKLVKKVKYAVLNKDDPNFAFLSSQTTGKVVTFAKSKRKVTNPSLRGDYNLYNIAAAETVAAVLSISTGSIEKAINTFSGVPGRSEEIALGQNFRTIVDFAHTPNALEQLLRQLRLELHNGKRIVLVFGCAGLRDKAKRPMMGEVALRLADKIIVTAEDPRTEKLDAIYHAITQGKKGFIRQDDRQKAIVKAVSLANEGDIVVVTGKGHEKSMCIETAEFPWSEQKALEQAIKLHALSL